MFTLLQYKGFTYSPPHSYYEATSLRGLMIQVRTADLTPSKSSMFVLFNTC